MGARVRLTYLTLGRTTNATRRRARAMHALQQAARADADHLVVTGDLTEDGVEPQFEVLAEVLAASGWNPRQVTLVPGNHDAYTDPDAWTRALGGPLRAYAPTSAPGVVVRLRDADLLPVSTAIHQSVTRSAGAIDPDQLEHVTRHAQARVATGRPLILAQHHPPLKHKLGPVQWIDGLEQHAELTRILERYDCVHVLHGHTHMALDRPVRPGAHARIFSTEDVLSSRRPLRVYVARHGRLWPELDAIAAVIPSLAAAW